MLTPRLLPSADRPADGLTIALYGCRRSVRLSEELLAAADARFSSITLEATDTNQLLLPELPEQAGPLPLRFSSVTARLRRVSVPRLTGSLFARRLAVTASFSHVQIGEIAAGAFQQTLLAPNVTIVDSRVGRIATGAFQLPLGVESGATPLSGLRILRSQVEQWEADSHVGGVLLHVLDSNVTQLRTRAVSTTGLVELYWNRSMVGEAERRAVYQHEAPPVNTLPPAVLGFYDSVFQKVTASNDSQGMLHFGHGVPSALEFLDNVVWGAVAAPVTPEPRPEQVTGTRLQCRCHLLESWLPDSEAFLSVSQCLPSLPSDPRSLRAADFYRAECDSGDQLSRGLSRDGGPSSSAARLAAAIAQLAVGLYSSRILASL